MSNTKIRQINTSKMRNDALFQLHTEFQDNLLKHSGGLTKVWPLVDKYRPLYDKMDGALKKINRSAYTKLIQDADTARDDVFVGMVEISNAARKHFSADVREASRRLKILFDTYGNVAKKPLNEQTSAVYNLMQDLEGKYAQDAETVGITQWAAELKAKNLAFSDLMKGRYDESAEKCTVVLKDARAELDAAYRAIVDVINAFVLVDGPEQYEPFIRAHNAVIRKYAAAAAAKAGRAKAKKAGGAAGGESEEDEWDESGEEGELIL